MRRTPIFGEWRLQAGIGLFSCAFFLVAGAGQAEKEWQNAAHSRSMRALSAAPAINVKPASGGVEIALRYITRASERYQLRSKLYQAAMNLISKKDSLAPVSISEKQDPKP